MQLRSGNKKGFEHTLLRMYKIHHEQKDIKNKIIFSQKIFSFLNQNETVWTSITFRELHPDFLTTVLYKINEFLSEPCVKHKTKFHSILGKTKKIIEKHL